MPRFIWPRMAEASSATVDARVFFSERAASNTLTSSPTADLSL
jgi:hypothetical protein